MRWMTNEKSWKLKVNHRCCVYESHKLLVYLWLETKKLSKVLVLNETYTLSRYIMEVQSYPNHTKFKVKTFNKLNKEHQF